MRFAVCCFALLFLPTGALAQQSEPFGSWLKNLSAEAVSAGVHPAVVQSALEWAALDSRVIDLDRRQPESTTSFAAYAKNVVTRSRISKGGQLLRSNRALLKDLYEAYGVSPEIVIALWGIESGYGSSIGNFNLVNALVTLAYDGRRSDFFRGELIAALQILDKEHINPSYFRGSWAGAMGQCQFMPSTYIKYAVDYDGDGRRDIWRSRKDVFASMSNYIAAEGWQRGIRWGREVKLSRPIASSLVGLQSRKTIKEWSRLGITNKDGKSLPFASIRASLVQPDGYRGRSFLVYDNFHVLMRWNRSTYFAVAVGLLSDHIAAFSMKRR